jgi:hypothetical protein
MQFFLVLVCLPFSDFVEGLILPRFGMSLFFRFRGRTNSSSFCSVSLFTDWTSVLVMVRMYQVPVGPDIRVGQDVWPDVGWPTTVVVPERSSEVGPD